MQQQIYHSLASLLGIVFTGIIGIAARALLNYLKTHQKMKWAQAAVRFVEETYHDFNGQEKFHKATDWLSTQLKSVGIKHVTSEELRGLIQSAVLDMRQEVKTAAEGASSGQKNQTNPTKPNTTKDQATSTNATTEPKKIADMTQAEFVQLMSKVNGQTNSKSQTS